MLAYPNVVPKTRGAAVINSEPRTPGKVWFEGLDRGLERGPMRCCLKEIPMREILGTKEVNPEAGPSLGQLPDPLAHKRNVHQLRVDDPKAPLGFRSTYGLPLNHVVLPFRARTFPKETCPRCVHFRVDPISQQEHTHGKHG